MPYSFLAKIFIVISLFACTHVSGQNEIRVANDPGWWITDRYDGNTPITLTLDSLTHAVLTKAENGSFGVVAVDDMLRNKWHTVLKGYSLAIGRFKEKVLVVAATDKKLTTSYSNTYIVYVLDPKTGKLLLEKTIYKGQEDYFEMPQFYFSPDGSLFKLAQRVTGVKKQFKVGLPIIGAITTSSKVYREVSQTQSFNVMSYDENLEVKSTFSPVIKDGDFAKSIFNSGDELFVITIRDENHLSVSYYKENKPAAIKTLELDIDVKTSYYVGSSSLIEDMQLLTSDAFPSSLFLSLYFKNSQKDFTLMVSHFNFLKGSKKTVLEVFTKAHIKELEKSFIPVNKKIDDAYLGQASEMKLDNLFEANGKFYVALGGTNSMNGQYSTTIFRNATLINAYSPELKIKFQQLIPRNFSIIPKSASLSGIFAVSYYTRDKKLCFLANTNKGLVSYNALYGEIDEETGKLVKTEYLDKGNVKKAMFINANTTLWSPKSFVITHLDPKGLTGANYDVMLQQMGFE